MIKSYEQYINESLIDEVANFLRKKGLDSYEIEKFKKKGFTKQLLFLTETFWRL